MAHKTDKRDIDYFESRVKVWQKCFGLQDWNISAFIGDTGENMATADMWHDAHGAQIKLALAFKYRPERKWLDRLAMHEVAHVMLCDLVRLTRMRSVSEWQIEAAEHAIIRRLENLLVPHD